MENRPAWEVVTLPSSTERNAMTSQPLHRFHGWIVPLVAACAAALALALPGIAHADDTSQSATTATPTLVNAPASSAGTGATPANTVDTSATATDQTTPSATDDSSATDTNGGTYGGSIAQPDSASWQ